MFETGGEERCWVLWSNSSFVPLNNKIDNDVVNKDDNLMCWWCCSCSCICYTAIVAYLVGIKSRTITTCDPRLQVGRRCCVEQKAMLLLPLLLLLYGSCVHFSSGAVRSCSVCVEQVGGEKKVLRPEGVVGGSRLRACCACSISSDARARVCELPCFVLCRSRLRAGQGRVGQAWNVVRGIGVVNDDGDAVMRGM